ncbi:MAG: efflux RND transporter periplasmic adaptor subunit, partial [Gammaproteobacteria bacterium]|nr:efflux RND transporter periplasmic adaptor subunit [Gammaproteobacteria bacterium]
FTTLGDSEYRWQTEVRQVLPTPEVLNDVVLYKALLDVDNPEGRLRSEMTAQVFFVVGSAKDAVLVPVMALQTMPERPQRKSGDSQTTQARQPPPMPEGMREARQAHPDATLATVLVVGSDGEPVPRMILTGLRTRTQAEVLYGLDPDETVVTGEVKIAAPKSSANQSGPPGPPPFMGR